MCHCVCSVDIHVSWVCSLTIHREGWSPPHGPALLPILKLLQGRLGSCHSSFLSSPPPSLSSSLPPSKLAAKFTGNLDIVHHHLPHRSPRSRSPLSTTSSDPIPALIGGSPLKLKHSLTTHDFKQVSLTRGGSLTGPLGAGSSWWGQGGPFPSSEVSEAIRLRPARLCRAFHP